MTAKTKEGIKHFLLGLVLVGVAVALMGYGVMVCWNGTMPFIFKLPVLTYEQSLGLFVLSQLLLVKTPYQPKEEKRNDVAHLIAQISLNRRNNAN